MPGTGTFYDSASRTWQASDELVLAFADKFSDQLARRRAIRMFLLHESLHERWHCLTGATSARIGRFAKVLEAVDYQADVWGMLHEYAFSVAEGAIERPREHWIAMLHTAIETFWAFDAGDAPMREIEVRRMNRYLNWYWQLLRIERCDDIAAICRTIATRPEIEISGPRIDVRGDRMVYLLDPGQVEHPELSVLHAHAIHRFAEGPGFSVVALIEAVRRRQGPDMHATLRGAFDRLPRR
jgi:hypothetical protein